MIISVSACQTAPFTEIPTAAQALRSRDTSLSHVLLSSHCRNVSVSQGRQGHKAERLVTSLAV